MGDVEKVLEENTKQVEAWRAALGIKYALSELEKLKLNIARGGERIDFCRVILEDTLEWVERWAK